MADYIRSRDAIDVYLAACALITEQRPDDAVALVNALEPTERSEMWLAGISVTVGLASQVATDLGIPPADIPTWLRTIATDDGPTA